MTQFKKLYIWIFFFLFLAGAGCSKPPAPPVQLTDNQQKFLKICREEYGLSIIIHPLENTFWIYLPKEESFLDIKASPEGPRNSKEAQEVPTIKFLDGHFEQGSFHIEYDIESAKIYEKTYGYSSQFTDQYQKDQRNILTAISRAFAEAESASPDFFIITIADIKKGLEARTTLAFDDLQRTMVDPSFQEEYTRRIIVDYPVGNPQIIGDKKGNHLEYKEMTWPEFLCKQMIYRVQSKYQRSSFPPSADTQPEILKIAAQTIAAYNFQNFESLELNDLGKNSIAVFTKEQLAGFTPKKEPPPGKFHTIYFR